MKPYFILVVKNPIHFKCGNKYFNKGFKHYSIDNKKL